MRKIIFVFLLFIGGFTSFCATKTFSGTGNFNDNTKWDSSILPAAGDDIVIDGDCTLSANETLVYATLIINATRNLSIVTYNLTLSGLTTVNGTMQIDTSADTGLTTAGLTINTGATWHVHNGSKINNSGAMYLTADTTATHSMGGVYTQTANATYLQTHYGFGWYGFILPEGITLTCNSTGMDYTTWPGTNSYCTVNGIISVPTGKTIMFTLGTTGTLTFGANSDVTGVGNFGFMCAYGATLTNNKTTAFSHTGNIIFDTDPITNRLLPAWNFANSNVYLTPTQAAATIYIGAGTLYCKNFTFTQSTNYNFSVANNITNPNMVFYGDVDLHAGAGTYTLTWNKGSGTIKLASSSADFENIDFDSQSMEAVSCYCSWTANNGSLLVKDSSLVDMWFLEETSGSTRYSVKNRYTFLDYLTTTRVEGKYYYGTGFSGGNKLYLPTTNYDFAALMATRAWTLSFWVKYTQNTAGRPVLGCRNCIEVRMNQNSEGEILVQTYNGATWDSIANDTNWNDGVWHLITVTCNTGAANNLTLYIDGASKGQATVSTITDSGFDLNLGTTWAGPGLISSVDEMMLWSADIGSTDVANVYNSGTGSFWNYALYELPANFSTPTLSGIAGFVLSSVVGTQRTITVTNTSAVTGLGFQDISVGSVNKINAKIGCLSLGNNKGIVFTDKFAGEQ